MKLLRAQGVAGAASARGTVVVIDVFRAFTVSAHALGGGAERCLLVRTLDEARSLQSAIPDAVLSAEVDGLPVPGIPISNSPTAIAACDLRNRTLIQRTSAGTQAIGAVHAQQPLYASALVVARATAVVLRKLDPPLVTLVASGQPDHLEDIACAAYLEGLLRGEQPDLDQLLAPLRASERFIRLSSGAVPGFPKTDVTLALEADRFDFAMPVARRDGCYEVLAVPALRA